MAGELPLVKLIELGLELCGTYSLPVNGGKTLYGHLRLTNVNSLKATTIQMKGIKGQRKACRALRFIADGSASPMETKLFMLLTLQYKLGGHGLPMPKLNKRVDPRKATKQMINKKYFVCDLFWPESNLAVEYDSNENHTGADRINDDSKKRIALESAGTKVITVTKEQIQNADELDIVAKEIAKRLGKQPRINDPKFKKAQRELRRQLGLE
jgi:very-short-patch-repair endonuclease